MRNVHERRLWGPADRAGALLDRLAGEKDRLWPAPDWPPLRLDRPLGIGAEGGHGPIRYRVTAYEPGRQVEFTFMPPTGLTGTHTLLVEADGERNCRLLHVLQARPTGWIRLVWPLALRWLHDALIEDLLDNAERELSGLAARPARWSRRVRLLRALFRPRARRLPQPVAAPILKGGLARIDLTDSITVPRPLVSSGDPTCWARAIFDDPPAPVVALVKLRQVLVGLVGIERTERFAFSPQKVSGSEAMVALDANHVDIRASIQVQPDAVILTTQTQVKNLRGRLYMLVVWPLHPFVVKAMMNQASRTLAAKPVGTTTLGPNRPIGDHQ